MGSDSDSPQRKVSRSRKRASRPRKDTSTPVTNPSSSLKRKLDQDLVRKIIVGIDFGTTYSGVAWAETYQPERRTAITTWPVNHAHREGESSDKVPTKLRYHNGETQWGFSIPVTAKPGETIEWFKL